MWSGLPGSLTLQLISIHVQKVHEHLICREGVIKGRCNLCFPQAWGGQQHHYPPPRWGAAPESHHCLPSPPEQLGTLALGASGTSSARWRQQDDRDPAAPAAQGGEQEGVGTRDSGKLPMP